jgi:hypothetical protein
MESNRRVLSGNSWDKGFGDLALGVYDRLFFLAVSFCMLSDVGLLRAAIVQIRELWLSTGIRESRLYHELKIPHFRSVADRTCPPTTSAHRTMLRDRNAVKVHVHVADRRQSHVLSS